MNSGATRLLLAFLLFSSACATALPEDLACQQEKEPVDEAALRASYACIRDPAVSAYVKYWGTALRDTWDPPDPHGSTATTLVRFWISRKGTVESFCVKSETTSRTRESVLEVLRTFEADVPPPEDVSACLVGKPLQANFSLVRH